MREWGDSRDTFLARLRKEKVIMQAFKTAVLRSWSSNGRETIRFFLCLAQEWGSSRWGGSHLL